MRGWTITLLLVTHGLFIGVIVTILQKLEPAVEFDTVANEKQQHEVIVGKFFLLNVSLFTAPYHRSLNIVIYGDLLPSHNHLLFELKLCSNVADLQCNLYVMQASQTHLDLEVTTQWWCFRHSSHE